MNKAAMDIAVTATFWFWFWFWVNIGICSHESIPRRRNYWDIG